MLVRVLQANLELGSVGGTLGLGAEAQVEVGSQGEGEEVASSWGGDAEVGLAGDLESATRELNGCVH